MKDWEIIKKILELSPEEFEQFKAVLEQRKTGDSE